MTQDNEIIIELAAMQSPLAGFVRSMPFDLPAGYFAQLPQSLTQDAVYADSGDPAVGLTKAMPFGVTHEYLAALPGIMMEAASNTALTDSKATAFEVPEGYFNKLPDTLLDIAQKGAQTSGRSGVIAFSSSRTIRWIQWAVAAMLVLAIGFGTYRYTHSSTPETRAKEQLARVDRDILNAYVEQHIDEFDAEMLEASAASSRAGSYLPVSGLDEQDIYKYLEEEGTM